MKSNFYRTGDTWKSICFNVNAARAFELHDVIEIAI